MPDGRNGSTISPVALLHVKEMSDSSPDRTPVLIAGAGPVGLALAGDLAWRGIDCTLVERGDGVVQQPRMDMVGIRTMEFCRRWGLVEQVQEAGYNREYPQDCAWVTDLNGYEFGREPFPAPALEQCPPQSPQKRERCPQNFFDPVLTRFARESGRVTFAYRTELQSFEQDGERVVATLRDANDGRTRRVVADYLVGCDGGASTVRQALGIGMSGEPVLTYTTNAIFRCDGLERLHDKKPGYRFIFIGPEGTWATLVAINGRDQWRFSLVGDAERRTVTEAEMRRAIVRAVGREFDFEILSMLPWVRRQLVADAYGRGRVFIAGDAAHLTSPTGGFGMNTGILDVVNLSWKLAGVLQGWGGPRLLESYEAEQRPVAIRNVTEAGDNLRRMLSPRILKPDPRVFDVGDPGSEQARREYGQRYTDMMRREWFSIGIHLGYVYEDSPIVIGDGTPPPADTVQTYEQTARPGSRAPHVWLAPRRSTLDLFGRGFVLLRLGEDAPAADALAEAARAAGVPLQVIDLQQPEVVRLYERKLVLVRPDGQVAWRADAVPADPRAWIDVVRGAAASADPRPRHGASRPQEDAVNP